MGPGKPIPPPAKDNVMGFVPIPPPPSPLRPQFLKQGKMGYVEPEKERIPEQQVEELAKDSIFLHPRTKAFEEAANEAEHDFLTKVKQIEEILERAKKEERIREETIRAKIKEEKRKRFWAIVCWPFNFCWPFTTIKRIAIWIASPGPGPEIVREPISKQNICNHLWNEKTQVCVACNISKREYNLNKKVHETCLKPEPPKGYVVIEGEQTTLKDATLAQAMVEPIRRAVRPKFPENTFENACTY